MSEVGAVCLNSALLCLRLYRLKSKCWQDYIPLGVLRMNAFVLIQVVGQIQLFGVVGLRSPFACLLLFMGLLSL